MLKIEAKPMDHGIEGVEYHSHHPYTPTQMNGEIRIAIQHQDLITLPSQSFLCIEGRFLTQNDTVPTRATITNNPFMFLFDEVRYELCGSEIERVRHPGITTSMKGYTSYRGCSQNYHETYGWSSNPHNNLISADGYFSTCIPLSTIFGFCEDYDKVIVNVKQELILIRSQTDDNCYLAPEIQQEGQATRERCKFQITSLTWRVPYLTVSTQHRLALYKILQKEKSVKVNFRCWEIYEYPLLPTTEKQIWNVKTAPQVEKPRWVMLAFQTERKSSPTKSASEFDHCNLINAKLYLNSKSYPYDDLNVNFDQNKFSLLYKMYADFQKEYYGTVVSPLLSLANFKNMGPIVVLDCSKQSESIKSGPIDILIEFESSKPFPANTAAYCLIIHDRACEYNPLTNVIRRMVV